MKYSLITHRAYGSFNQKVTVVKDKSSVVSGYLAVLKGWAELIASLDNQTWDKGSIVCDTMTEVDDGETGNTGTLADLSVNVMCKETGKPLLTLLEVKDCTQANLATKVTSAVFTALGVTITSSNTGIVNVTMKLH